MRIHLLAIGTRMPAWVDAGFGEYRKRLPADMRLELEAIPLPKRARGNVAALVRTEGEAMRKRLDKHPGAHCVALDVAGKPIATETLSRRLGELRDLGQDLVLLVGGPDGLCPTVRAAAHERWSLSALTLPHPLVRVLLAEQLYRGWTLLAGHPYHR